MTTRAEVEALTKATRRVTKRTRAMATSLDSNPIVRQKLKERIIASIEHPGIPVAVLHQVAQCIEMWERDQ